MPAFFLRPRLGAFPYMCPSSCASGDRFRPTLILLTNNDGNRLAIYGALARQAVMPKIGGENLVPRSSSTQQIEYASMPNQCVRAARAHSLRRPPTNRIRRFAGRSRPTAKQMLLDFRRCAARRSEEDIAPSSSSRHVVKQALRLAPSPNALDVYRRRRHVAEQLMAFSVTASTLDRNRSGERQQVGYDSHTDQALLTEPPVRGSESAARVCRSRGL